MHFPKNMTTSQNLESSVSSEFNYDSMKDLGKYVWKYAIKPGGFVKMTKESAKENNLGWEDKLLLYPAAYLVEGIRDFGYLYLGYSLLNNIF